MTTDLRPLTDAQARVYRWICEYIDRNGFSPTVRELCEAFEFSSPQGGHCHLVPLRKKGWITWVDGTSRTIPPTEVSNV